VVVYTIMKRLLGALFLLLYSLVPATSLAGILVVNPGDTMTINICAVGPKYVGSELVPGTGCTQQTATVTSDSLFVTANGSVYRTDCVDPPAGGGLSITPAACNFVQVSGPTGPTGATAAGERTGLVPCGRDGQEPCQTCHVVVLVNDVIKFLLYILGVVAAIIIVYAGARLVFSGGNRSAMEEAKSMISSMIIGYVIILAGWLLVDTGMKMLLTDGATKLGVWNQVSCVAQPEAEWVGEWTNPDASLSGSHGWSSTGARGETSASCIIGGYNGIPESYDCTNKIADCTNSGGKPTISVDGRSVTCSPTVYGGGGGGSCTVVTDTSNACHPSKLNCFGNRENASKICNLESQGGDTGVMSGSDLCKDGKSFSGGLWQINMLANYSLIPGCNSTFFTKSGSWKGNSTQGSCLDPQKNRYGQEYCAMFNCEVKSDSASQALYQQCKAQILNPTVNSQIACGLYGASGGWGPWQTSAKSCGVW
jgi:Type IV secretion system pilin